MEDRDCKASTGAEFRRGKRSQKTDSSLSRLPEPTRHTHLFHGVHGNRREDYMSSVFSKGQGQKRMRRTDSAIADKQIFTAAASPTSEGLKRSAASKRAGRTGPLSEKGRSRNRNAG